MYVIAKPAEPLPEVADPLRKESMLIMPTWDESPLRIADLKSVQDAITDIRDTCDWEKRPYWRGHGDSTWSLKPEIFRAKSYREAPMLWDFITRGASRFRSSPAIKDRIGWLHLAQHYGLPTRLLDWSTSPLVALFFAVSNEKHDDRDGCIWALNGLRLNEPTASVILVTTARTVEKIVAAAFGEVVIDIPSAVAISATENDLRMLVQQAAFTLHSNDVDLRDLPTPLPILRQFIIPKNEKPAVRDWLAFAGISQAALFPDLVGLAAEIKQDFS